LDPFLGETCRVVGGKKKKLKREAWNGGGIRKPRKKPKASIREAVLEPTIQSNWQRAENQWEEGFG